ncbi:MAG: DUF2752 domain-containing protein [Pseudonocardia sp.]|nr:DUF2752 domain-containing protein [Pseudonocardia sp.]
MVGYVVVAGIAGGAGRVVCPFRLVTGRRCPLCGTSRAVALAVRGRWRRSLATHPLGVPLACYAAYRLARVAAVASAATKRYN